MEAKVAVTIKIMILKLSQVVNRYFSSNLAKLGQFRVRATAQFHFDTPQPACWRAAEIPFKGLRGASFFDLFCFRSLFGFKSTFILLFGNLFNLRVL